LQAQLVPGSCVFVNSYVNEQTSLAPVQLDPASITNLSHTNPKVLLSTATVPPIQALGSSVETPLASEL